ncbi:MAG TPA: efflux RND transporter periplasmic adaptor subunit [Steroidobacteraceae bacterium]|jgi:RND family efflux transporter MFP subunit|nr:efflux RND transporter periplasmic adaptor subunit [Steroidobacteraceae bacterium]
MTLVAGALVAGCGKKAPPEEPPPTVLVAQPLVREVRDWDDYAGRFEAVESVEVRPRVSGMLQAVHFRDGQTVKKGQLLFTIDPRPIEAQLAQSQAQLERAKAAQVNADAAYRRGMSLSETHIISEADLEVLAAAHQQAAADVAAAAANVKANALNLEFTRVVAPLDGQISRHRLAPGNLVEAGVTLLTTIVTLDPIRFVFDAPEAALLKYKRAQGSDALGNEVDIRLQDETEFRWKGRIEFVDNALDAGSGTIRARALVRNPTGFLTPGMFGHMRRFDAQPVRAMLIPDESVVNDETRQVAYVVGSDDVVQQRSVELGRLIDDMRVIRSGLAPSDRVIISGVQRARPGRKVNAQPGQMSAFPSGIARGENSRLDMPSGSVQ